MMKSFAYAAFVTLFVFGSSAFASEKVCTVTKGSDLPVGSKRTIILSPISIELIAPDKDQTFTGKYENAGEKAAKDGTPMLQYHGADGSYYLTILVAKDLLETGKTGKMRITAIEEGELTTHFECEDVNKKGDGTF